MSGQAAKRGTGHGSSAGAAPTRAQRSKGDATSHRESVDSGNAPQPVQRKVIGHYMLGKTIGEGTFGKVKIAIHLPTGEKVCIADPRAQCDPHSHETPLTLSLNLQTPHRLPSRFWKRAASRSKLMCVA